MSRAQAEEFYRAAGALRGADKTVMAEVGKGMRKAAKPVVAEIRSTVRATQSRSQRGVHASAVERQLHILGRSGRKGVALTERQVRSVSKRLAAASSLRAGSANATCASVSAGPAKVALSFRVSARQLPPSQRKLPRRWDNPSGWKHPVFGNRDVWVRQTGGPYFSSTVNRRRDDLTGAVIGAMDAAADRIVHPTEGPAL
jgi:hypothetical protein